MEDSCSQPLPRCRQLCLAEVVQMKDGEFPRAPVWGRCCCRLSRDCRWDVVLWERGAVPASSALESCQRDAPRETEKNDVTPHEVAFYVTNPLNT